MVPHVGTTASRVCNLNPAFFIQQRDSRKGPSRGTQMLQFPASLHFGVTVRSEVSDCVAHSLLGCKISLRPDSLILSAIVNFQSGNNLPLSPASHLVVSGVLQGSS